MKWWSLPVAERVVIRNTARRLWNEILAEKWLKDNQLNALVFR